MGSMIEIGNRDESYFVRGYTEHRSDVEESGVEETSVAGEKDDRTEEDRGLNYDSALDDEILQESQPENQVKEDVERELGSIELGKSTEVHDGNLASEVVSSDDEEAIEKQYVMVQKVDDDSFEIENGKVPGGESDSPKEGDADCSPSSSWKHVEKENSSDEDSSEDSGSDRAESSSPDASMADIIPMLDELHPLLDLDAPQPAHLSRDGSHAASEKSQKSEEEDDDDDDDSVESDEDNENHGEADENGVDEEEGEMEGGKEDERTDDWRILLLGEWQGDS
ncbi:hypothetical protein TSUD_328590 [Trifolium subterraneum]|uniref:Uncharacterized protein n=1 Tax=Trifolium subterraneum TaxID=3900 RepID=A0A2Z6LRB6_TRISU|nr:hypothetical protein TSUD_328590 [Trifolium subterraneum]